MGEACSTDWSEQECLVGKPEWKGPLENLGLDDRAILKWIFIGWEGVDRIHLAWDIKGSFTTVKKFGLHKRRVTSSLFGFHSMECGWYFRGILENKF
jgi:hypothetical protein